MIVLTGAAGFIGSCILAKLNAIGREDVITVDHLNELKKRNLVGKKFQNYLDKKEFIDLIIRDQIPFDVKCIIHMGACSSTTLQDAQYFEENNFEYTHLLAQWALAHKARFIYASSAATYGDGSNGYKDDETTTRLCKPLNLYGESKQKFDLWILDQGLIDKVVGLKFFNVFGPNEYHKDDMRSVVAKAYQKVVQEGKIELFKSYRKEYGHGEQKRDFIYVKDAVDIVMYFFGNPHANGIYNVGTGDARSWNDLAAALFMAVGKSVNVEYIEMPEMLRSRYQYFTQADMSKLRKIGYAKAFTRLEDAVGDYVKYLRTSSYF